MCRVLIEPTHNYRYVAAGRGLGLNKEAGLGGQLLGIRRHLLEVTTSGHTAALIF